MLQPAYKLTIGGKVVDTTDQPRASTAVELNVVLDIGAAADSCALVLGNVGGLAPKRGDEAEVALGYADDEGALTRVIKGEVDRVEPGLETTRVVVYGGDMKLMRSFTEQTFKGLSAGAIVRDLAGRASVPVERAEDGIGYPVYVVDGERSIYAHMLDLAESCGFDLYLTPDGKLVFEKFQEGRTVHVFEYAKHIVSLDVQRATTTVEQVEVWGESATATSGDDAAAWVTTDFSGSKGVAGTGRRLLLQRPSLRTATAARTAAQAALTEIKRRSVRGHLVTIGRPEVKLGDAIRIAAVPDASLNGNYQVRGVNHRVTKSGGFATRIDFRVIDV
jgi:phage protein D